MSNNHEEKASSDFENMTENDWFALDFEISGLFDGAPIDEEDLFAGRLDEVTRMLRAVMEKSKHMARSAFGLRTEHVLEHRHRLRSFGA